jgi:guanylate kinase
VVDGLTHRIPFRFSVSMTTRRARPGETDGEDYFFVDRERFERAAASGELLEWAEYAGNLYGTPRGPVMETLDAGHDVLLDIELVGARQIREAFPGALMIFIAPPGMEELERRLRSRGDTDEDAIEARLGIASEQMAEAGGLFDHVVVNADVDEAIGEVVDILARPPTRRPVNRA